MARLPQPGGDSGNWGIILNDYLSQSLTTEGALKASIVTPAHLAASTPSAGQVLSYNGSGFAWSTVSGSGTTPDASTSQKGLIQLAGDLSGTATAPTVPGLASKADASTVTAALAAKADTSALTSGLAGKANVSHAHAIADITDLQDALDAKPDTGNLASVAVSGDYDDLSGKPTLAAVAATGSYADLTNKPTVPVDNGLVHLAGNETITGTKNFTGGLQTGGQAVVATNDARLSDQRTPSDNTVTTAKLQDGSVTESKLNISNAPAQGNVLGWDGADFVWSAPAAGAGDATTSAKGVIQLSGDLGGTAASPTVPGLSGKESTITVGTTAQYYRGDKSWQTLDKAVINLSNVDNTSDANKPVSLATQTALDAKATSSSLATVATSGSYVDLTNKPTIPTVSDATSGGKGIVQLAGDLSGTAAAPTLASTTNVTAIINANTNVSGAAQKANNLSDLASVNTARTNLGVDAAGAPRPSLAASEWATNTSYKAGQFVLSPLGAFVANTQSLIQANSNVAANTSFSAGEWSHVADINLPIGTTSGTVAAGNDSRFTSALQSGATAGGDLSGTLPSPTVAKVNGVAVTGTPSNGQVITASSATAASWATPAATTSPTDIQIFTASGTWTKPAGARVVEAFVVGPGGGGGSGRRGAAGTVRCGGGGGGGGGKSFSAFRAADVTATVTVTVGTGGAGGAAVVTDSTDGQAGNFGGTVNSTFGSYLVATRGVGGGGGSASSGGGGTQGGPNGTSGAPASTTGLLGGTSSASSGGGSGGGAGGGITTGDVVSGGGGAYSSYDAAASFTGGGAAGVSGVAGIDRIANQALGGAGGSGGGSSITGPAGAGGAGGKYGGGGGGGGASLNGNASGAGGAGGDGIIVVISYF